MNDHININLAPARGLEGALEILKEVLAPSTPNDARATGQVETEMRIERNSTRTSNPREDHRLATEGRAWCDVPPVVQVRGTGSASNGPSPPNEAGIEPRKPAPTADYNEKEWNRIIDIDLRGVFLCMKYEIPLMLKQGGGAIVNTSSGAGVIGIKGSPAYTAAKHGVIGLTRAAALGYAAQNIS